jgi:hypothetical protein
MKKLSLLQSGLLAIGVAFVMTATHFSPPQGPLTAYQRGQLVGQGIAEACFLVLGFGLIIAHFVKKHRAKQRPNAPGNG